MDIDDTPVVRILRLRALFEAGVGLAALAYAFTLWHFVMGPTFAWLFTTISQLMFLLFAAIYAKFYLSIRWSRSILIAGVASVVLVCAIRLAFGV